MPSGTGIGGVNDSTTLRPFFVSTSISRSAGLDGGVVASRRRPPVRPACRARGRPRPCRPARRVAVEQAEPVLLDAAAARRAVAGELLLGERLVERVLGHGAGIIAGASQLAAYLVPANALTRGYSCIQIPAPRGRPPKLGRPAHADRADVPRIQSGRLPAKDRRPEIQTGQRTPPQWRQFVKRPRPVQRPIVPWLAVTPVWSIQAGDGDAAVPEHDVDDVDLPCCSRSAPAPQW